MHYYRIINDELYCEDLSVNKIAEVVETPFYLYSQKSIQENFDRIDASFQAVDHYICYALKANSNPTILSLLAQQGAGADVVSGGEIYLALKSGFPPEKIVYASVGKRDDEIRLALEKRILALNVESLEELKVINKIAKNLKKKASIALRINPNIDIHGQPYIATGKSVDKFGIDIPKAKQIFHQIKEFSNIELIGIHCHIGSQITKIKPYLEAVHLLRDLVEEWRVLGFDLKFVDIGGGLGVRYENVLQENLNFEKKESESLLSPESLVNTLLPDFQTLGCKIIFEPGRSLLAEAGILVTKVLFRKEIQGKRFVIVDAGMNDLIRPSLYRAYHEIIPVKKNSPNIVKADVVGPLCESGDFLAKDRLLPEVLRGDFLAVMTAGAYGFVLSCNYNARPRPAEVLVHGDNFKVIRERGKIETLWS